MLTIRTGDRIHVDIYGHREEVIVLAIHTAGTIDVERLSDGRCFRITGLAGRTI